MRDITTIKNSIRRLTNEGNQLHSQMGLRMAVMPLMEQNIRTMEAKINNLQQEKINLERLQNYAQAQQKNTRNKWSIIKT